MVTRLTLGDLKEGASLKADLPPLRVGEKIRLPALVLRRKRSGRTLETSLEGVYRVEEVTLALGRGWAQEARLVAQGVAPAWRTTKNPPPRVLGPTQQTFSVEDP